MASTTADQQDTAPDPTAPLSRTAPGRRDALLDNAKFLLIALVVIGHALAPSRGTPVVDAVSTWIYAFHMPAFIVISGYLSKSFDASPRRVERLVLALAVPYLLFWSLHVGLATLLGHGAPDSPLDPAWTLWFLVALFVWRLSVPLWQRLRWPLATAVAISFAAAFVELGAALDVGRILSLLPFFVLGLALRPEHLDFLRRTWVRVGAVLVLAASVVAAVPTAQWLSMEWFFWRSSLIDRDVDPLGTGLLIRIGCFAAALLLTAVLLSLTPRRRTVCTDLGLYTLYVYLGHSLVLRIVEHQGWYEWTEGAAEVVVNTALGLAVTLLLCLPWVRAVLRPLVEPNTAWLLKPPARSETAGRADRSRG